VVRRLARGPRSVIALGGGAVLHRSVRHWLRRSGHLVWLQASPEVLAGRLGEAHDRPLLAGDVRTRLQELQRQRDPLYGRLADAAVDVDELSPAQAASLCANAILRLDAERAHAG
jgi:shikimate kinase